VRKTPLTVLFSAPTFNAGEVTRGIELASALRSSADLFERDVDIRFLSASYTEDIGFLDRLTHAGFETERLDLSISPERIGEFMKADHSGEEFLADPAFADTLMQAFLTKLHEHRFDLVVYGFSPAIGIAAQITRTPAVSFLPFPPSLQWVRRSMLKDVPDMLENRLTLYAPRSIRRLLTMLAGYKLISLPFFRQPTLDAAGRRYGWAPPRGGLCDMLAAERQLVCDLPIYYEKQNLDPDCHIVGPLFPKPEEGEVDSRIAELLSDDRSTRVFVVMGSSGERRYLQEAAKAVMGGGLKAVIVAPASVGGRRSIESVQPIPNNVYVTEAFVPSHLISPMADVTLIHGGQGTVQTAVHSGTPFVGVAMQAEQQYNLDSAVTQGAGIRIPKRFWEASRIRKAIRRIRETSRYKDCAAALKIRCEATDARRRAVEIMRDFVAQKVI
jgi:hypothetical protein